MSISEIQKKRKRGRPVTTGTTPLSSIRIPLPMLRDIDAWAKRQPDRPAKAEAIRRLLAQALAAKGGKR
jgi:hypothetical protein